MAAYRRDPNNETEFNSPAEMLRRVLYLLWLISIPAAILLTLSGLLTHKLPLLLGGGGAMIIGWICRERLRRSERLESTANSLDALAVVEGRAERTHLVRLALLLREWDALEQRRGQPDFDPWAVQAVRNDILALVNDDPALLSLFRGYRQAA